MLLKNQFQLCSTARERSQAKTQLSFTIFILIRMKKQCKGGVPLYPHILVIIVTTRNAEASRPVGYLLVPGGVCLARLV